MIYIHIYFYAKRILRLLLHRNNSLLFSGWEFRKGRFIAWITLTIRRREWYHANILKTHTGTVFGPKKKCFFFFFSKHESICHFTEILVVCQHFYAANFSSDILSTTSRFRSRKPSSRLPSSTCAKQFLNPGGLPTDQY